MSDTSNPNDAAGPEHAADRRSERPGRHRRPAGRVVRLSVASGVLCAAVAASYWAVNHPVGNIPQIPNGFAGLNEAARPVAPAVTRHSMTVLLTSSDVPSTAGNRALGAPRAGQLATGLIMLLHLNADEHSGAVVSIPPDAVVSVPGHGAAEIGSTPLLGGTPLLIKTVGKVTRVRIDHYAVMDFAHTHNLIDELGGVNVEIPAEITTSGVTFHPGPNHLNGTTALSYVRQPGVPGGEEGRVLRQQSLTRAIVGKIGARHLLGKPRTYHRVLNAFTEALSGDSNFTNTELRSLALRMHSLTGRRGTYVTAPARTVTTPSGNTWLSSPARRPRSCGRRSGTTRSRHSRRNTRAR